MATEKCPGDPATRVTDPETKGLIPNDDSSRNPNWVEAEKGLVRKLDMTLLPMTWVLYMFNYLDRNNIALVPRDGGRYTLERFRDLHGITVKLVWTTSI